MRIGVVVNPDAGLGGKLGFKGSDGRASEARAAGAEDRAGPRMEACLSKLSELLASSLNRTGVEAEFYTWDGRMGGVWLAGCDFTSLGDSPASTSADDTKQLVSDLVGAGVELILYAGGDGTTRDIVNALAELGDEAAKTPLIGVPGGVKMHSGCFATTPKAAAEVALAFMIGDLRTGVTEVMDLDEEIYQQGVWKVRMYGEAWTPSSPRFMQGAKEQVERESEEDTLEALADHVATLVEENPGLMVVWGSGGTLKRMAQHLGHELTLLGIDIVVDGVAHKDLNESQLLDLIGAHDGPIQLLLSPMGGQGFLIGRGNLQLSAEVLRAIGLDNLLGVATPAKLLGLTAVRIDTGDPTLDDEFAKRRFVKILQGYRTTRLLRVAE